MKAYRFEAIKALIAEYQVKTEQSSLKLYLSNLIEIFALKTHCYPSQSLTPYCS